MRRLQLTKEISPGEIKNKMQASKSLADYKRWQIIFLVSSYTVDADFVSDITGYSKASIYSVVQQFNKHDKSDVTTQKRGGRRRFFLTLEQEKIFMNSLEERALEGKILSYLDIKKLIEKEVNRTVSDDYVWDLFKRNGWTKHSPRPHHPKRDLAKQDEFKKNSKSVWLPLKMILEQI